MQENLFCLELQVSCNLFVTTSKPHVKMDILKALLEAAY